MKMNFSGWWTCAILLLVNFAGPAAETPAPDAVKKCQALLDEAKKAADAKNLVKYAELHQQALAICENATVRYNLACALARAGRKVEALAALKKSVDGGYSWYYYAEKEAGFNNLHQDAEWNTLLKRMHTLEDAKPAKPLVNMGKRRKLVADANAATQAKDWKRRLTIDQEMVANGEGALGAYNIACDLAMLGQKKEALDKLAEAVKDDLAAYLEVDKLESDSELAPLHSENRYAEILQQYKQSAVAWTITKKALEVGLK